MKKAVLFLGLLGVLVSCSGTPSCDDKEVIKLVEELGMAKGDFWWAIHDEYYADKLEQFSREEDDKLEGVYEEVAKKYGVSLWQVKNMNDLSNYPIGEGMAVILPDFWDEMKEELGQKIDAIVNDGRRQYNERKEYLKANYQTDEKIKESYDKYYSSKISNIRPISSDKENKKCECEATLNLGTNIKDNIREIYYTAQKNTDGEVYVEMLRL